MPYQLSSSSHSFSPPICSVLKSGVWPFVLVIALCHLILRFLDWFVPRKHIDLCHSENPFLSPDCKRHQRRSSDDNAALITAVRRKREKFS